MIGKLLSAVAVHQGVVQVREEMTRRRAYDAAAVAARVSGKPLLVVGGPVGTSGVRKLFNFRAHGCGDVCLDVDAAACVGCSHVAGDVREIPYPDGHFGAAICAHVLEHMPTIEDCARAWGELNRVADAVFLCLPGKDGLMAWLAPDHHLWVMETDRAGELLVEDRQGSGRRAYLRDGGGAAARAARLAQPSARVPTAAPPPSPAHGT